MEITKTEAGSLSIHFDEIEKKIKNCKIVSIEPVFDTKLLNIWDIGLRPIFKPLVLMIDNKDKIQIKKSKK